MLNTLVVSYLFFVLLQVAHCYPDDLKTYPQEIIDILQTHNTILDNEMRMVSIMCIIKLHYANKLGHIIVYYIVIIFFTDIL